MGTTQPIRKQEELRKFKDYYLVEHPNQRNYTLIVLGLNTALRISDILSLTWGDIYDFPNKTFHSHICLQEQKTGKYTMIALNHQVKDTLKSYQQNFSKITPETYLFFSRNHTQKPISRSQAYRIIKEAAKHCIDFSNPEHISCHSLRKTFGYHAWKQGIPPAVLMEIYNHSSFQITKKYLCIDQDDKDNVFLEIEL